MPIPISPEILDSEIYASFYKYLENETVVPANSQMWQELEKIIDKACPRFLSTIRLLVVKNLKPNERRTLFLLKCGFSPSEIEKLISMSQGGVSSRRKRMSVKMFGVELNNTEFDRLIRLM